MKNTIRLNHITLLVLKETKEYIADHEQQINTLDHYSTTEKAESHHNTNAKNNSNEYIETSIDKSEKHDNQEM